MVAATEAFLATLDDAQREQVSFEVDSDLKESNWSNLPAPLVERSGVPFGDMTEEQQQAAMAILQAALSEEGYQKTIGIMVSDQAGDLPAFVPAGLLPTGTVRPMGDENDLAFELINALDPEQQEQTILDYEVSDLVLGAGEDVRVLEPEGIPTSEMTADQQALLLDVVRQWAGIANEGAADARMSEIEDNLDETYFAWSGPTTYGEPIYYRVTGPTLHIEFSHQDAPPPGGVLHIHSVYRDPTNDYGEQSVAG